MNMKSVILLLIIFFTTIFPTVNLHAAKVSTKGDWATNVRTRALRLSPFEIYTEDNSVTIHLKDALQNMLMWKHYISKI